MTVATTVEAGSMMLAIGRWIRRSRARRSRAWSRKAPLTSGRIRPRQARRSLYFVHAYRKDTSLSLVGHASCMRLQTGSELTVVWSSPMTDWARGAPARAGVPYSARRVRGLGR
jgi:hypothetical protein